MKVIGIAGFSGSGKTTLIERMIPLLTAKGRRVSVLKHAHHGFDIDRPGKDSWRHREAGAGQVMLYSDRRWALLTELPEPVAASPESQLGKLISEFAPCDLILVEGFRHGQLPKIEVHRAGLGHPLLFRDDPDIVAVASDEPVEDAPRGLDLNDPAQVARFIDDLRVDWPAAEHS